jgi:molecular chaperone GrpE
MCKEEKKVEEKNDADYSDGADNADSTNKDEDENIEKKFETDIENEKTELELKYKRALADFQNLLKRTAEEKAEFAKFANEQLILEIIPVYDHLVISFEHIDESARNNGWGEGIKYVVKQFSDVLKNMGVEEIDPTGKEFDPRTMEAIEGKGERVKKTVKRGYVLKGKVIVPARVILE